MADTVESEVKLVCKDVVPLIAEHPELGWSVVKARHFEDNFVFELPGDTLANRGSILRLRVVDGVATFTYKGLVPESTTSAIKVREELETGVEHPEILVSILERLGMRRAFRYQKFRTVYALSVPGTQLLAMFDETPMGNFLEIEGEESRVVAAAGLLGFSKAAYVNTSYIGVQAAFCRARGVPLEDLVFAGSQLPSPETRERSFTASATSTHTNSSPGPRTPDLGVL
jgi:adenylate cyclase, class 2